MLDNKILNSPLAIVLVTTIIQIIISIITFLMRKLSSKQAKTRANRNHVYDSTREAVVISKKSLNLAIEDISSLLTELNQLSIEQLNDPQILYTQIKNTSHIDHLGDLITTLQIQQSFYTSDSAIYDIIDHIIRLTSNILTEHLTYIKKLTDEYDEVFKPENDNHFDFMMSDFKGSLKLENTKFFTKIIDSKNIIDKKFSLILHIITPLKVH